MNLPSNEEHQHDDLIGYVLGALDPDEHQQIAQLVERDLDLQREILRIRAQVTPLDGLVPPGPPPAGLARRTCESVAAEPVPLPAVPAKSAVRPWFSNQREPLAGTSSWSLSDFITVAEIGRAHV